MRKTVDRVACGGVGSETRENLVFQAIYRQLSNSETQGRQRGGIWRSSGRRVTAQDPEDHQDSKRAA